MTRQRTFPVHPDTPADDETLIYKIFGAPFDSTYLVIGETVFISDEGIQILATTGTDYDEQNAYTFIDANQYEIGGLYARDNAGQNIIGVRGVDPQAIGDDILVELIAAADPTNEATAEASVNIQAARKGGTTDTYITLKKDNSISEIDIISADRVQISPQLQLLGASDEECNIYIKGTNLIIVYDDGGTTRYKYLDLSGTGVTWQHSTNEP